MKVTSERAPIGKRKIGKRKNDRRRRSALMWIWSRCLNSSEAISYRDQWIDLSRPALRIMATHEGERWTVAD